jgi:hypothetical protein
METKPVRSIRSYFVKSNSKKNENDLSFLDTEKNVQSNQQSDIPISFKDINSQKTNKNNVSNNLETKESDFSKSISDVMKKNKTKKPENEVTIIKALSKNKLTLKNIIQNTNKFLFNKKNEYLILQTLNIPLNMKVRTQSLINQQQTKINDFLSIVNRVKQVDEKFANNDQVFIDGYYNIIKNELFNDNRINDFHTIKEEENKDLNIEKNNNNNSDTDEEYDEDLDNIPNIEDISEINQDNLRYFLEKQKVTDSIENESNEIKRKNDKEKKKKKKMNSDNSNKLIFNKYTNSENLESNIKQQSDSNINDNSNSNQDKSNVLIKKKRVTEAELKNSKSGSVRKTGSFLIIHETMFEKNSNHKKDIILLKTEKEWRIFYHLCLLEYKKILFKSVGQWEINIRRMARTLKEQEEEDKKNGKEINKEVKEISEESQEKNELTGFLSMNTSFNKKKKDIPLDEEGVKQIFQPSSCIHSEILTHIHNLEKEIANRIENDIYKKIQDITGFDPIKEYDLLNLKCKKIVFLIHFFIKNQDIANMRKITAIPVLYNDIYNIINSNININLLQENEIKEKKRKKKDYPNNNKNKENKKSKKSKTKNSENNNNNNNMDVDSEDKDYFFSFIERDVSTSFFDFSLNNKDEQKVENETGSQIKDKQIQEKKENQIEELEDSYKIEDEKTFMENNCKCFISGKKFSKESTNRFFLIYLKEIKKVISIENNNDKESCQSNQEDIKNNDLKSTEIKPIEKIKKKRGRKPKNWKPDNENSIKDDLTSKKEVKKTEQSFMNIINPFSKLDEGNKNDNNSNIGTSTNIDISNNNKQIIEDISKPLLLFNLNKVKLDKKVPILHKQFVFLIDDEFLEFCKLLYFISFFKEYIQFKLQELNKKITESLEKNIAKNEKIDKTVKIVAFQNDLSLMDKLEEEIEKKIVEFKELVVNILKNDKNITITKNN